MVTHAVGYEQGGGSIFLGVELVQEVIRGLEFGDVGKMPLSL